MLKRRGGTRGSRDRSYIPDVVLTDKEKERIQYFVENNHHSVLPIAKFTFRLGYCSRCGACCRRGIDVYVPKDKFDRSTEHPIRAKTSSGGIVYIRARARALSDPDDGFEACQQLEKQNGVYKCKIHNNPPTICRDYPRSQLVPGCSYMITSNVGVRYFREQLKIWRAHGKKQKKGPDA